MVFVSFAVYDDNAVCEAAIHLLEVCSVERESDQKDDKQPPIVTTNLLNPLHSKNFSEREIFSMAHVHHWTGGQKFAIVFAD